MKVSIYIAAVIGLFCPGYFAFRNTTSSNILASNQVRNYISNNFNNFKLGNVDNSTVNIYNGQLNKNSIIEDVSNLNVVIFAAFETGVINYYCPTPGLYYAKACGACPIVAVGRNNTVITCPGCVPKLTEYVEKRNAVNTATYRIDIPGAVAARLDLNIVCPLCVGPAPAACPTNQSIPAPIHNVVPTGRVPTGRVPTGIVPTGRVPTGRVPTGIVPTGKVPTGIVPTGKVPTGKVLTGKVPTGKVPTGKVPTGIVPTGSLPTGKAPNFQAPHNTLGAPFSFKNSTSHILPAAVVGSVTTHILTGQTGTESKTLPSVCPTCPVTKTETHVCPTCPGGHSTEVIISTPGVLTETHDCPSCPGGQSTTVVTSSIETGRANSEVVTETRACLTCSGGQSTTVVTHPVAVETSPGGFTGEVAHSGEGSSGFTTLLREGSSGSSSQVGEGSSGSSSQVGEGSLGSNSQSGEGSPGPKSQAGEGSSGSSSQVGEGSPGPQSQSGGGSSGSSSQIGEGSSGFNSQGGEGSPGPKSQAGEGSSGITANAGSAERNNDITTPPSTMTVPCVDCPGGSTTMTLPAVAASSVERVMSVSGASAALAAATQAQESAQATGKTPIQPTSSPGSEPHETFPASFENAAGRTIVRYGAVVLAAAAAFAI
ncbi:hypothetical protein MMC09_006790 [Bachmanniomyces sp. S44760]|nr:hypothetical protein [Bachmanniomyces sp. S44760]